MIRIVGLFRGRRKAALAAMVICLTLFGGTMLARGLIGPGTTDPTANPLGYNAEKLLQYKTPYVGDNSRVVGVIDNLPFAQMRREVSLQTQFPPYGVTVDYDFNGVSLDAGLVKSALRDSSAVMFALIGNVDNITFNVKGGMKPFEQSYTRAEAQGSRTADLRDYARDVESLQRFLDTLSFRLHVFPEKYTLAMSSTPGMLFAADYRDPAARVRYTAGEGSLFSWDASTGVVSKGAASIEIPVDSRIYWTPLDQNDRGSVAGRTVLTAALFDGQGRQLDERRVNIRYDGSTFYTVQPAMDIDIESGTWISDQRPMALSEAVGMAVKSRGASYLTGETTTEGHVIMDSEESDGVVRVYTIASIGNFGFENGVFTKISGSGAIPTVMTFLKNQRGEYTLMTYQEPADGEGYLESIQKMFPVILWPRVFESPGEYGTLERQQEEQAAQYLRTIGREAEVRAAYVEKQLVKIDVQASNQLFSYYAKDDRFLNECPYWIGTRERVEDGVRFIYETAQAKTDDGYDLVNFKKTKEDRTVVEERRYKIVGSEPVLLKR